MTFEELLAEGQRILAAERAALAAAEEAAKQERERKQQEFTNRVWAGVQALLPEALWPDLQIEACRHSDLQECEINAPDCAPIRFTYDANNNRLGGPFSVPSTIPGRRDDWGEFFPPDYSWSNGKRCDTRYIGVALAAAREAHAKMADLVVEHEAFFLATSNSEITAEPATDPGVMTAPDLVGVGEQLAVLIRRIVREELADDA